MKNWSNYSKKEQKIILLQNYGLNIFNMQSDGLGLKTESNGFEVFANGLFKKSV